MRIGKFLHRVNRAIRIPRHIRSVVSPVRERHLTYLSVERLDTLVRLALANERRNVEGMIVEAGCALGGSSIVLAATKSPGREMRVYRRVRDDSRSGRA